MKIDEKTIHSEEEILTALQEEFDQTVEFVVMDNGDDFIQTSGGELEYRANGRNYRVAASPVDQEKSKLLLFPTIAVMVNICEILSGKKSFTRICGPKSKNFSVNKFLIPADVCIFFH